VSAQAGHWQRERPALGPGEAAWACWGGGSPDGVQHGPTLLTARDADLSISVSIRRGDHVIWWSIPASAPPPPNETDWLRAAFADDGSAA
jgi:hypothetical protein